MSDIPPDWEGSKAINIVNSLNLEWRKVSSNKIELEMCPYCGKHGYGHLNMNIYPPSAPEFERNLDGTYNCYKCGEAGNLWKFSKDQGYKQPAVDKPATYTKSDKDTLPDVEACHEALMQDEAALDYLLDGRGFSREIIERQKLGLKDVYFRETGVIRAIVYPYLVNGRCVWAKYRSLPTMPLSQNQVPKAINSPSGFEAALYNGEILRPGLKSVVLVEGEPDCIAALDQGIDNVCGVPGANIKKADWISAIERLQIEKVYICYDIDNVGRKAARTLASRIGIDKCYNVSLPDFNVVLDDGSTRPGKDLNEWFQSGATGFDFLNLLEESRLFDIDGVTSSTTALAELTGIVQERGVEPKYKSPWPSLNRLVGFDEGDVIDILAPEKIGKTTLGLNLMEHMVDTYGEDGVIVCLEMTTDRMAKKYAAMKGGIRDFIPANEIEAAELQAAYINALPEIRSQLKNRKGELLFSYPRYKTADDVYNHIKDCIRRYGVKWVMVDNLQRLADTTSADNRNRTSHLSEISKALSQIAKDYKVQMIRILQPHRIADGKMIDTNDVDGASQIAKDNDCMLTMWRQKLNTLTVVDIDNVHKQEQTGTFGDTLYLTVGLTRYSQGGRVTLLYDGARSTVREFTTEEFKQKDKALQDKFEKQPEANVHYQQLEHLGLDRQKRFNIDHIPKEVVVA